MEKPNIDDYIDDDDFPHKYIKDLEIWEGEQEGMGLGSKFWVDIPSLNDVETWINVAEFSNREDAIRFAQEVYGADENGMVSLVTG